MNDVLIPNRPNTKRRTATIVVLLALTAMVETGSLFAALIPVRTESLGACVRNNTLFPATVGNADNIVDAWSTAYHTRVAGIVDEHTAFLDSGGSCLSEDTRTPAQPKLTELIKELPEWKNKTEFSQEDMAAALTDYLQQYECALQERSIVLEAAVFDDFASMGGSTSSKNGTLELDTYEDEIHVQARRIEEEQTIARDALKRTLTYLSGHARVWRVQHSLQCLEGAMLDIRNALSLAADASACMPKLWDTQTFLRSFKTE
jgi:hypothetical protein